MVRQRAFFIFGLFSAALLGHGSALGDGRTDATDRVLAQVKHQLTLKYAGAKIELTSNIHWVRGGLTAQPQPVRLLDENARGESSFAVGMAEGYVTFAAWVPARVAVRRIHPGERLSPDLFMFQDINVASGAAREYRGVILPRETDVGTLESRQSVLEGQFLTSTAVEKVPDLKRGDVVNVHVISGGLVLSTQGTAEAPAYIDGQARVMTAKSKRELVGKLSSGGIVEVNL